MSATAGKEVKSYCTSCRLDLAHTVVSVIGDRVAKVECRTCKKTHAYRPAKGVTERKTSKGARRASKTEAAVPVEMEWQRLMTESRGRDIQYSIRSSYRVGDKVNHLKFGTGVVSKTIHPNKIEVVFQNDIKVLLHEAS